MLGDEAVVGNFSSCLAVVLSSIGALGIDNNQKNLSHRVIIFSTSLSQTGFVKYFEIMHESVKNGR